MLLPFLPLVVDDDDAGASVPASTPPPAEAAVAAHSLIDVRGACSSSAPPVVPRSTANASIEKVARGGGRRAPVERGAGTNAVANDHENREHPKVVAAVTTARRRRRRRGGFILVASTAQPAAVCNDDTRSRVEET